MTQKIPEFDVAIIGAGIAGSALASALSNTSLRVVVIEGSKFPQTEPACDASTDGFDARVSALTLASQDFLQQLGVWSNLLERRAQPFTQMQVWDGEGTGEIRFDSAEIGTEQLGFIVENRVIVYSLLESLQMCANVKLLDQTKVQSISHLPGGERQQIQLHDGRTINAALVVGADGANSFVRTTCQFKTREWDYGHHAIVCTIATEKPHAETAWQRFMPTGPLAFLPLPSGDSGKHFCSIVWSADVEESNRLMALDDNEFRQALTRASEAQLGKVLEVSRRFSFPLRQRHAVDYVQQGIALVADAAHTIHPLAGQGINLGLQDVRVLAEELIRAKQLQHQLGDLRVLSRYQRRRKGENLLMMGVMEGFKRLFAQQSLLVRWARNKGMLGLAHLQPLKKQIMKQAMGVK